jgi:hypothetical protein
MKVLLFGDFDNRLACKAAYFDLELKKFGTMMGTTTPTAATTILRDSNFTDLGRGLLESLRWKFYLGFQV